VLTCRHTQCRHLGVRHELHGVDGTGDVVRATQASLQSGEATQLGSLLRGASTHTKVVDAGREDERDERVIHRELQVVVHDGAILGGARGHRSQIPDALELRLKERHGLGHRSALDEHDGAPARDDSALGNSADAHGDLATIGDNLVPHVALVNTRAEMSIAKLLNLGQVLGLDSQRCHVGSDVHLPHGHGIIWP